MMSHDRMPAGSTQAAGEAGFTCPMHPDVRSAQPGRCPKCGMPLVAIPTMERGSMEPGVMMAHHHGMALWVQPVIITIGLWLIVSPFMLGYLDPAGYGGEVARITRLRSLADPSARSFALALNDIAAGMALIALGLLGLSPTRAWTGWIASLVGAWLFFAPLVFWAPAPAAYLNETLVGVFVIGFAILIPHGMPMEGSEVPPGWTYNPSSWLQRFPVIALGLLGFFLARGMAAYQMGHSSDVFEPFFGDGSRVILESEVSRWWPIPDAGLGAAVYMLEALMGMMGDPRRWRTMPWMVMFFGILVIPLGITSIVLVIMQPLVVGTWCTTCLLAALAMLVMIPLALDEVVAMLQFVVRKVREGGSLWRTFWLGGDAPDGSEDGRTPSFTPPAPNDVPAMVWGVTLPWHLVLSVGLGLWLMAAPAVLQTSGGAADSDHLLGALVVVVAMIAWAEVGRPVRYLNIALGLAAAAAPWLLAGDVFPGLVNDAIVGALLVALSLPRGQIRERYGSYHRLIV